MINESFEKIANELGCEYKETSTSAIGELQIIEEQKNELIEMSQKEITLHDKQYLLDTFKDLINDNKAVLTVIRNDIKIGCGSNQVIAYAKLNEAVTNQLKELLHLNKVVMDTEVMNDNLIPNKKSDTNVNINMTGKELLDFVKMSQAKSQINEIDATIETIEYD